VAIGSFMRMRVRHLTMPVQMFVDEVGPNQQVPVAENRCRPAVGDDSALLAQHHGSVGDQRHDVEFVSGLR